MGPPHRPDRTEQASWSATRPGLPLRRRGSRPGRRPARVGSVGRSRTASRSSPAPPPSPPGRPPRREAARRACASTLSLSLLPPPVSCLAPSSRGRLRSAARVELRAEGDGEHLLGLQPHPVRRQRMTLNGGDELALVRSAGLEPAVAAKNLVHRLVRADNGPSRLEGV